MARVLILRDGAAARRTAAALQARGHEPVPLPVTRIVQLDPPPPDLEGLGCVLVSSANAVPFAAAHLPLDVRLLAVGEASAAALRAAGFGNVIAADGTGEALGRLAAETARGREWRVLHLAGVQRSGAIEKAFGPAPLETLDVYCTQPLTPSGSEIAAALGDRPIDAVLLLSVGQARGFLRVAAEAPTLFRPCPHLLCLSGRVAAVLPDTFRAAATVSPTPELSTLFDLL